MKAINWRQSYVIVRDIKEKITFNPKGRDWYSYVRSLFDYEVLNNSQFESIVTHLKNLNNDKIEIKLKYNVSEEEKKRLIDTILENLDTKKLIDYIARGENGN